MKTLFLSFLLFINISLFAEVDITKKASIDALLNKTNAIALAHMALIEDRAILSADTAVLKNNSYLDINFTDDNLFGGNISYTATNTLLSLNTSILSSSLAVEEKEYFLNNYHNSIFGRVIKESGGFLQVSYFYPKKALSIILNNDSQNTYIGASEPSSYASPSSSQTWWDSTDNLFNVKKYVGSSWVNEDYNNQNLTPSGGYANINTLPLSKTSWAFTQVTSNEENMVIKCDSGANYNPVLQRCEAYTSNACDGESFDTISGLCYKKPINYCASNGFTNYDEGANRCWQYSYSSKIAKQEVSCGCGYYYKACAGYYCEWRGFSSDYARYENFLLLAYFGGWNAGNADVTCGTYDTYGGVSGLELFTTIGSFPTSAQRNCHNIVTYVCPASHPLDLGNGQCRRVDYLDVPSVNGSGYNFSNNSIGGLDAYVKAPSCFAKNMSISPYSPTSYYGNNGLCYSDVGLYCKNTGGLSYDGIATCWKYNQSCNTGYNLVYNYASTNDKCSKFNYSCAVGTQLYGLTTRAYDATANNTSDLFNRILNKDVKANNNAVSLLTGNDVVVNDNQGSMCVSQDVSTFSQGAVSPSFTINAIQKSGF